MNITRRDALRSATAAAVVTGATLAPLAIKAAGAKAALGGGTSAAMESQFTEECGAFRKRKKEKRDDRL